MWAVLWVEIGGGCFFGVLDVVVGQDDEVFGGGGWYTVEGGVEAFAELVELVELG